LITEEDQNHCKKEKIRLLLRKDLIDQPFENQWSEKCQKTSCRKAQETGRVKVEKRPGLSAKPEQFAWQPTTFVFSRGRQEKAIPHLAQTSLGNGNRPENGRNVRFSVNLGDWGNIFYRGTE
jgi:hypothetical protein